MIELDRLRDGDPAYFRHLIEKHGGLVMAHCIRYASSEDEAAELFHSTWIRIWEKREGFRGEGMFEAWIVKVARSVCLDARRSAASRSRAYDHFEGAGGPGDLHWMPRRPDESAEGTENRDALLEALDRLPPQQRIAVVLKYLDDKTDTEAAKVMGVAEATVRSTARDGKKNLMKLLEGRF